ncbi:hypothetical protein DMA11_21795 [Marinilabiliaceae bacterium JC017]|nr:hypothetical protein DMA11_21795 [Marinilabiliaceae bacterium JC017]
MQDFLHASHDEVKEALEQFEQMLNNEKELYFDVHQIENIYDFYSDNNKQDEADRILQIGLKQHPQATSLQIKQASLLTDRGNYEEARQLLERLVQIEYTNSDVFLNLGWIYLNQYEQKKAIEHFHKAVEFAFEDEEDILFEIGYNLSQEGLYREAIPFFMRAKEKYPPNENLLFELAFCLDKMGLTEDSIAMYHQLLDINPFSENGWYNLGILYNKQEKYTEAVQAYEYTSTINPNHPEACFNKGNSLAHAGLFSEALEAYLDHASMSKDNVLTYQYIADCWEQLGNYDMAIRFFRLVTTIKATSPDAWYGLGTSLMGKEQFESGLQAIDQAISINPMNADYWFAHARGLFELDKVDDATRSLENGLNLDPNETSGWIELLKLKLLENPNFELEDFMKDVLLKYPEVAAVNYLAMIVYVKHFKDNTTAKQHLEIALSLDPDELKTLMEDYSDLFKDQSIVTFLNDFLDNQAPEA